MKELIQGAYDLHVHSAPDVMPRKMDDLEMAQRIMELRQRSVTEFRVACDPGVGLYAAEIINILREKDKSLRLV